MSNYDYLQHQNKVCRDTQKNVVDHYKRKGYLNYKTDYPVHIGYYQGAILWFSLKEIQTYDINGIENITASKEDLINFLIGFNFRNYIIVAEFAPSMVLHTRDRYLFLIKHICRDYLIHGLSDTNYSKTPH